MGALRGPAALELLAQGGRRVRERPAGPLGRHRAARAPAAGAGRAAGRRPGAVDRGRRGSAGHHVGRRPPRAPRTPARPGAGGGDARGTAVAEPVLPAGLPGGQAGPVRAAGRRRRLAAAPGGRELPAGAARRADPAAPRPRGVPGRHGVAAEGAVPPRPVAEQRHRRGRRERAAGLGVHRRRRARGGRRQSHPRQRLRPVPARRPAARAGRGRLRGLSSRASGVGVAR